MFRLYKVYGSYPEIKSNFSTFLADNKSAITSVNLSGMEVELNNEIKVIFRYVLRSDDLYRMAGEVVNDYEISRNCVFYDEVKEYLDNRVRLSNR
jgi:hypothetical protein